MWGNISEWKRRPQHALGEDSKSHPPEVLLTCQLIFKTSSLEVFSFDLRLCENANQHCSWEVQHNQLPSFGEKSQGLPWELALRQEGEEGGKENRCLITQRIFLFLLFLSFFLIYCVQVYLLNSMIIIFASYTIYISQIEKHGNPDEFLL